MPFVSSFSQTLSKVWQDNWTSYKDSRFIRQKSGRDRPRPNSISDLQYSLDSSPTSSIPSKSSTGSSSDTSLGTGRTDSQISSDVTNLDQSCSSLPSSTNTSQEHDLPHTQIPVWRRNGKFVNFFRSFIGQKPKDRTVKHLVFGAELTKLLADTGDEGDEISDRIWTWQLIRNISSSSGSQNLHAVYWGIWNNQWDISSIRNLFQHTEDKVSIISIYYDLCLSNVCFPPSSGNFSFDISISRNVLNLYCRNLFDEQRVPNLAGDSSVMHDIHCVRNCWYIIQYFHSHLYIKSAIIFFFLSGVCLMYQPPDQFCAQALLPALADPAGHVRPLPSPRPRQQADRAETGGEVQGDPAEAARGSLQVRGNILSPTWYRVLQNNGLADASSQSNVSSQWENRHDFKKSCNCVVPQHSQMWRLWAGYSGCATGNNKTFKHFKRRICE